MLHASASAAGLLPLLLIVSGSLSCGAVNLILKCKMIDGDAPPAQLLHEALQEAQTGTLLPLVARHCHLPLPGALCVCLLQATGSCWLLPALAGTSAVCRQMLSSAVF